jgi:hypothetical protein
MVHFKNLNNNMTKIKTILLSYSILLLCIYNVHAQSGTVASGGNATGVDGSVSYTVGTTCYTTISDGSTVLTQGIQQPYEIQVVNGMEETGIALGSVYPNPTTDYVMLSLNGDLQNMHYTLCDVQGKFISRQNLVKQQTNIPMASLTNGAYLVKVYNDKKQLKTFKIIKNN